MKRRGETVDAVEIAAARSARRVLTTGFTPTNTTARAAATRSAHPCESANRQALL
jgi:hypothetical protein